MDQVTPSPLQKRIRKTASYASYKGLNTAGKQILDHIVERIYPVLDDSVLRELRRIRGTMLNARGMVRTRSGHPLWIKLRKSYDLLSSPTRKAYYVVLIASYGIQDSTVDWLNKFRGNYETFVNEVEELNGPYGCATFWEPQPSQPVVYARASARSEPQPPNNTEPINKTFTHFFAPIEEPGSQTIRGTPSTPNRRRASGKQASPIPLDSSPLHVDHGAQGATPERRKSIGAVSFQFFKQVSELEAENQGLESENLALKTQVEQYRGLFSQMQDKVEQLQQLQSLANH